ncbi:1132_t:CDS:2 [Entrophospora sp. SA101]|nr:16271_t:CDS:2 [Entrophospora sp. SA101]CAJ0842113.1 1132_t:CDS:2 [Entrophospora sp. SA101]
MFSVAWNSFATLAVASFSPDPVVVGTTDAFAITGILNYDIIETDNTSSDPIIVQPCNGSSCPIKTRTPIAQTVQVLVPKKLPSPYSIGVAVRRLPDRIICYATNLAKVWPVFALIIVARATLTSENSTLLGDPMKAEGKTLGREIPVKISIFLTSAKDVKRSDPFVQQIPRQGRQFSGSSQLLQYDLNLHLLCVLVTSPAITQYLIRCPCPGFSSRTNRLFFAFLNIGGSVFYPQKDRVVVKDEHLKR